MKTEVKVIHTPLEISVLVSTEANPLGEYMQIVLQPGIPIQLVDHYATPVAGFKGLQLIGRVSLVSLNTKDAKELSFFVGKQAYTESIVPPPETAETT